MISSSMWSACCSMMRWNWALAAGSMASPDLISVEAEPLIELSGARSSWLTMARNAARMCSRSSSGARSCTVTTTDSTRPSAERMGVALTSALRRRPSGACSTISSARTVSPVPRARAMGDSTGLISRPSARW